jgi:hypothetical protein
MNKLEKYRSYIQTLLEKYSQSKPRNEDIENELFVTPHAIGMGIFTILMVWDIYAFGEKIRDQYLSGEVFGPEGKAVLLLLGFLIVFGWYLAAPDSQITKPNQIIALLFPVCFLAVFRWFSWRKHDG